MGVEDMYQEGLESGIGSLIEGSRERRTGDKGVGGIFPVPCSKAAPWLG